MSEAAVSSYDSKFRGLENKHGRNNCYLNVVIQSLWHLISFRINFLSHKNHRHSDKELVLRHKRSKMIQKRQVTPEAAVASKNQEEEKKG